MSDVWWFVIVALGGWTLGNFSKYSIAKYASEKLISDGRKQAEQKAFSIIREAREQADRERQQRLSTAIQKEAELRKQKRQLDNLQYELKAFEHHLQKREKLVENKKKDIEKSRGKIRRLKDKLQKEANN